MEWIWRQLTYGKRIPLKKLNHIYVVKDDIADIGSKVEKMEQ
jgi:hypothetical protein